MTRKIIIHIVGIFFLAFGITTIVQVKLGAAPLEATNQFFSLLTNGTITLGAATFISNAIMTLIILISEKKPKILFSLIISLILSVFIDLWGFIYGYMPIDLLSNISFRILLVIVSIIVISIFSSILILNDFIMSPYDEFILFISDKVKSYQKGRTLIDVFFITIAFILGIILNYTTDKLSLFSSSNIIYQQINVVTILIVISLPILIDRVTKFIKRRINSNEVEQVYWSHKTWC